MKLNHLDLQVPDIQETARFLEKHFGFQLLTSPTATALAVLKGEGSFSLVLQKLKNDQETYPEGFHIGFVLDEPEKVYAKFEELKSVGIQVGESVIVNSRGTLFYFYLPGKILAEVSSSKRF